MVYDRAKLILGHAAQLSGELSAFTQGIKGQVRLLANTVALGQFLPGPLCDFLRLHPGVDIDLDELPSEEITRAVAGGAGIAVLPIAMAANGPEVGGVISIPLDASWTRRQLFIAVRAHAELPLPARRLVDFLTNSVR